MAISSYQLNLCILHSITFTLIAENPREQYQAGQHKSPDESAYHSFSDNLELLPLTCLASYSLMDPWLWTFDQLPVSRLKHGNVWWVAVDKPDVEMMIFYKTNLDLEQEMCSILVGQVMCSIHLVRTTLDKLWGKTVWQTILFEVTCYNPSI